MKKIIKIFLALALALNCGFTFSQNSFLCGAISTYCTPEERQLYLMEQQLNEIRRNNNLQQQLLEQQKNQLWLQQLWAPMNPVGRQPIQINQPLLMPLIPIQPNQPARQNLMNCLWAPLGTPGCL